jgi:hypothetical protein
MSVIRLVDYKTKQEVAICKTFAINERELVDVTTFGAPEQTWMPAHQDVIMYVENFKTPVEINHGLDEKFIERGQIISKLGGTIVALVRMMGGAVSISELETDETDRFSLETEETPDGVILRVKDDS